jgi:hypothetical protein
MTSILKVSEIQDPTNSNTALSIDSSGIITYPQKIVWYANNYDAGSNAYAVNNAYAKHAFTEVIVNHGNGYSGTNSRFTAPVAGTYFVNYSMHFRTGTGYKQARLHKNGSSIADYARQVFHRGGSTSSEQTLTANLYIDLAVNDYIEVFYFVQGGDIYYFDLCHFGGHFIG